LVKQLTNNFGRIEETFLKLDKENIELKEKI
jgi:hypothetical protein